MYMIDEKVKKEHYATRYVIRSLANGTVMLE